MGAWPSEGTCVLESLSWSLPLFPNSVPIEKPTLHVGQVTGESLLGHAGPGRLHIQLLVFPGCVPVPELCSLGTVPCHQGCDELSVACVVRVASAGPEYLTVQTAGRHLALERSHPGLKIVG